MTTSTSNKFQGSEYSYLEILSPPSTIMKASGILTMSGDDEVGQHIRSINKPGPKDIFFHRKRKKRRGKIRTQ